MKYIICNWVGVPGETQKKMIGNMKKTYRLIASSTDTAIPDDRAIEINVAMDTPVFVIPYFFAIDSLYRRTLSVIASR